MGHEGVTVAHYGSLRGSNTCKGFDIILAQVYYPNLEVIIREGRALFAADPESLDDRVVVEERMLTDDQGDAWTVQVPTFADWRLAAPLERRRDSEMAQCALCGRPFDHPDAQITLLFSLPLPGPTPTTIVDPTPSPTSNGRRQAAAVLKLIATQVLLAGEHQRLAAIEIAQAARVSEVTTRAHWGTFAETLDLN